MTPISTWWRPLVQRFRVFRFAAAIGATTLFGGVTGLAGSDCADWFRGLPAKAIANAALGRELSDDEAAAIGKARVIGQPDLYTASEVTAQDRLLDKAGLAKEDIARLRQRGILGNSVLEGEPPSAPRLEYRELTLAPLDAQALQDIKSGNPAAYVIDRRREIHLVRDFQDGKPDFDADALWMIQARGQSGAAAFEMQQAGTLTVDARGRPVFHPSYESPRFGDGQGSAPSETMRAPAKTFDCLALLEHNSSASRAVVNKLIGTNAVFLSSVTFSELSGAGRLRTADGARVLGVDLVGTNIGSLIGSAVGVQLIQRGASFGTAFAVRSATGMGMIQLQKRAYQAVLQTNGKKRSGDIAHFDTAWFFANIPVKQAIDKAVMQKLPGLIYDQCRKGSKLSLVLSPGLIRIYENAAFTYIYYGTRKAIINE